MICDNNINSNININNDYIINNNDNNDISILINKIKNEKDLELKEINFLLKSFGLTIYENRNENLIKIKEFLLVQENIRKEFEEKSKLNSFNKEIPKLNHLEIIEPSEVLFWRVFRDKYLFHYIFSKFNFKHLKSYDQLSHVPSIFQFYKYSDSIIKDKVKSGSYLAFDAPLVRSTFVNQDDKDGLFVIYKSVYKNTIENQQFYFNLFSKYKNQFEIMDFSIKMIIKSNNKMALKEFIKYFNISTQEFNNILLNLYGAEENRLIIDNYKSFKMFNYLQMNYNLPDNYQFKDFNIFNSGGIVSQNILKFKNLLKICTFFKINKNFQQFCEQHGFGESISEFEEYKSQFNREQLNLTVYNYLNMLSYLTSDQNDYTKNDKLRSSINRLLTIYYNLFNKDTEVQHKILFDDSFQIQDVPLKFKIDYFRFYANQKKNHSELLLFVSSLINEIEKKKTKDKQFHKFNNFKLIMGEIQRFQDPIKRIEILDHFLQNSNYSQYFSMEKEIRFSFFNNLEHLNILDYFFNSPKYRELIYKDLNIYWLYISKESVFLYYENKMKQLNRKLLLNNEFYYSVFDDLFNQDLIVFNFILRAIKIKLTQSSSVYEIDSGINFDPFKSFFAYGLSKGKQSIILEIFKTGVFKTIPLYGILDSFFLSTMINQIADFILKNYNKKEIPKINSSNNDSNFDLTINLNKNSTIKFQLSLKTLVLLYSSCSQFGECYQFLDNSEDILLKEIICIQITQLNFDVINQFIKYYNNTINNTSNINLEKFKLNFKETLCLLFQQIFSCGDFQFLKYIVLNFSFLLGNQFLNEKFSQQLLMILIRKNYLEMIQLFLNFIDINETIFNDIDKILKKNNNSLGYIYFKKLLNK